MGAPKTVQRQITTHFGPQEGRRGLASAKLSNCPAKKVSGRAGNRTRDLSHPKRQSCH